MLLIASEPVSDPAAVGANLTVNVAVEFGFSVNGKLPPERLKPVPVTEAEFTVTADEPDDVSVRDCVADEFTVTLPKLRLVELSVN